MDARQQSPKLADKIPIKSAAEKAFFPILMGFRYRFHGEKVLYRIFEQELRDSVCRSDSWEIAQGVSLHSDSRRVTKPIGFNPKFG